ncbi:MAG: GNAT family N-acetyltransferase [Acidimicrobiales bacterium]
MTVSFRVPSDDDFGRLAVFDGRAFGSDWKDDDLERVRPTIPLDRFVIGENAADGQIVAAGGAYAYELTLPGLATVDAACVTWIAVAVTHRRQGLLTTMMRMLDEAAADRGEPVMVLTASEGSIYRRFGYGSATSWRATTIDRRFGQVLPSHQPAPGSVRIVDRDGIDDALFERWDRYRRAQPGELSRSRAWFPAHLDRGTNSTFALHDDGYAAWSIEQKWDLGHPRHELTIRDFCAATPEAHAALWHTILSVDLVGEITSMYTVAPDDQLPYLLDDPRALRTIELNDFLWVAVRDVAAAFSARSYRTDDRLVLGTEYGRFAVEADRCVATTDDPDLVCETDALGPLLLGSVSASALVRGRRIQAEPGVASRADAFFGHDPVAHCRTPF